LLLTIAQREEIVRYGLGDREPAVRSAAGSLVGKWADAVEGLENVCDPVNQMQCLSKS
jgi:condensin complex subunit 3